MSKANNLITANHRGHPIIAGEFTEYKYNHRHLDNNLQLLEAATSRHNKVYSWRMDIRLPQSKDIQKHPKRFIRSFMSAYTKKLSRRKCDPDYAVKMERDSSSNPHFHIQMITDGNKVKDYRPQVELAEGLLAEQLDLQPDEVEGLIDKCNGTKNGIMIRRNSPNFDKQFDEVHKQMSYLAKDKDNDAIPTEERKIMYSRFRRDKCRRCK
jgi:Inovirus Gp2